MTRHNKQRSTLYWYSANLPFIRHTHASPAMTCLLAGHELHTFFCCINDINCVTTVPLQWLWHMGFISRIYLLPKRKLGMWCLWTWAILDTRHQCALSTRANSRLGVARKKQTVLSFRALTGFASIVPPLSLAGSCHSLRSRAGRQGF